MIAARISSTVGTRTRLLSQPCIQHIHHSTVIMHARSLHNSRICNSNSSSERKKPDLEKPKETPKSTPSPNSSQTTQQSLSDKLGPYIDQFQEHYNTTSQYIHTLQTGLKKHYSKAKQSIQQVNEKLAQQEKESSTHNFNESATGSKIENLPSAKERNRKLWAKKLELYLDSLQETIFTATRALNDVTGYSSIQQLRQSIETLEKDLKLSKEEARLAKEYHQIVIGRKLETQREINELLQRKSNWSPSDLERFTKLYTVDQENSKAEEEAGTRSEKSELREQELQDKLSNAILTRYHEEQIWSDKIRRTSTWGTFGLMGLNILFFLVFQLLLEPWKRRRLVGNFEDKVKEALRENTELQNEKLDEMAKKVEELNIEGWSVDLDEANGEVIDDYREVEELVQYPVIQRLPIIEPKKEITTILEKLHKYWISLVSEISLRLERPFRLIFFKHYNEVVLLKEELVWSSAVCMTFGLVCGVLLKIVI